MNCWGVIGQKEWITHRWVPGKVGRYGVYFRCFVCNSEGYRDDGFIGREQYYADNGGLGCDEKVIRDILE